MMCPTEIELFLASQRPDINDHVSGCEACSEVLVLVRRAAAEPEALSEMTDGEVNRVARFVFDLIRKLGE